MSLPIVSRMKARAAWQSPSSKYVVWMKPFVQVLINGRLEAAAPTAQGSILPEAMATGPMTSTGKLYQIVSTPKGLRAIWTGPQAQLFLFNVGGLPQAGPVLSKGSDLTPYAAIAPTGGGGNIDPNASLAGVPESAAGTLGETNVTVQQPASTAMSAGAIAYGLIGTASMAASAYHGYKRNDSIGWALVWGVAGSVFPIITPVIAVAQGFGEKAKSSK